MPTYEYSCYGCDSDEERCVPIDDRDKQLCLLCDEPLTRHMAAPAVMNVAMADGTRRFDNVRRYRALERAKKAERDTTQQAKLQKDMDRLTGRSD